MNLRRTLAALMVLGCCAAGWYAGAGYQSTSAARWRTSAGQLWHRDLTPALRPPALVRALRPAYPYSVIPGGVYSAAELRFREEHDPVVRAHFADFDTKHTRLVTLTEDRTAYVSYRRQNTVYWTKTKLRIPKGELLITDGLRLARSRCGNRLSETPKTESSTGEPTADLSLPPMTLTLLRDKRITFADSPESAVLLVAGLDTRLSPVSAVTPMRTFATGQAAFLAVTDKAPTAMSRASRGLELGPMTALPMLPYSALPYSFGSLPFESMPADATGAMPSVPSSEIAAVPEPGTLEITGVAITAAFVLGLSAWRIRSKARFHS